MACDKEPEIKLYVERIRSSAYGQIQYRIRIGASFNVDAFLDEITPAEIIAGYLVNELREFVSNHEMDKTVPKVIEEYKVNKTYHCSLCGHEFKKD